MKIFIMRGILQRFCFRVKESSERVGQNNGARRIILGDVVVIFVRHAMFRSTSGRERKKVRIKFLSLRCLSVELDTEEELGLCVCIYIYISQ